MKIKYQTLGFFIEVISFILTGYFLARGDLVSAATFLVLGGIFAYIVGRQLVQEGKDSREPKDINTSSDTTYY